ncbi:unnamed protein product [Spirodela intermedia]|uniref:Uncharacterized protein n=1 Tax=Spirodela intermedia TaxID=51605 RepID=A0A7I8J012_SPIIN|nr:unnamed protein product [Spirodela intermedia]CAA6663467.1 unnamed protein product [Spirodela intermedia]
MASGLPPGNLRHLQVAGAAIEAFVTNRAQDVDEWVQQLEDPCGGTKIVGLSFFWDVCSLPDGSLRRTVYSIHVSYVGKLLVYHLSAEVNGVISTSLVNFLCDLRNIFFGEDIHRSLHALGFYGRCRHSFTMELTEVARICGVSPATIFAGEVPPHVALGCLLPCTWPMNDFQVQLAAQTSFVAQKLGMCVYSRNLF